MNYRADPTPPVLFFRDPTRYEGYPEAQPSKVTEMNRRWLGPAFVQHQFTNRAMSIWAPRYKTNTAWAEAVGVDRWLWGLIWCGKKWLSLDQIGFLADRHGPAVLAGWMQHYHQMMLAADHTYRPAPSAPPRQSAPDVTMGLATSGGSRPTLGGTPVTVTIESDLDAAGNPDLPTRLPNDHPTAARIIASATALAASHRLPEPDLTDAFVFEQDPEIGPGASGDDVGFIACTTTLDADLIDDHAVLAVHSRHPGGQPDHVTVLDMGFAHGEWRYTTSEKSVYVNAKTGRMNLLGYQR